MDETIAWDETGAIRQNTEALKRVLAGLFVMARLAPPVHSPAAGGSESTGRRGATLPRYLYLAVLRLLRPAESAARRLIIAAACTLVVTLQPARLHKARRRKSAFLRKPGGTGILLPKGMRIPGAPPRAAARSHSFPLLDPPRNPMRRPARRRSRDVPRICVPGLTERHTPPPPPSRYDLIDAQRLARRLATLASALDDLPGQARRFARWRAIRAARAKAEHALGIRRARRVSPLRLGRPPGSRSAASPGRERGRRNSGARACAG